MNSFYIFIGLVIFCLYILGGLHVTNDLETFVEKALGWTIYTVLWISFINIFAIGYFWSVVAKKTGPAGLRGHAGERGGVGIEGKCSITEIQVYFVVNMNKYIDSLYNENVNKSILNKTTQKFPCDYLNDKLRQMASSRQYQVIVSNLSSDNKSIDDIINYIKSIWKKWFDLIYKGTEPYGKWFTDQYADEEYDWVNNVNPFDEIKKYDIYYWGVTRNFRPLKAEICRSTSLHESSKMPLKNIVTKPRIKVIYSNDYRFLRNDYHTRGNGQHNWGNVNWWEANTVEYEGDTYYPIGQIIQSIDDYGTYSGKSNGITRVGNSEYNSGDTPNGPDRATILVAGDVVPPEYRDIDNDNGVYQYWGKAPKGYVCMGDFINTSGNIRCVPEDCVEEITNGTLIRGWTNYYADRIQYVLENPNHNDGVDGNSENAYYNFRVNYQRPFYRIKDSALVPPKISPPSTKDVEPKFADLGIGWNGHPYKMDPKYSIFSFLNLVPEGIIVHSGSGQRFYIIHYGGEDINIFNVLAYNTDTDKYDNALQSKDQYNVNTLNRSAIKPKSKFEDVEESQNITNTFTLLHPNGKPVLYDPKTDTLSLNKGSELFIDVSYNVNDINDSEKLFENNIKDAFINIDSKKIIAEKFLKNNKNSIWYSNLNEDNTLTLHNNNRQYIGYDNSVDNIIVVPENDSKVISWNIKMIN